MEIRSHIVKKYSEITNNDEESKSIDENTFKFVIEHCRKNNISNNIKNAMFKNLYIAKSRQLYHNLKSDSYVNNTQLSKLIKKKKIKIELIAYCSYKELFPSRWKKFNKDLEILNKDISDFDKELTTTDQFTCEKCKKSKCVYAQFQIRSSDEPMTSFITCLECGHNWRE